MLPEKSLAAPFIRETEQPWTSEIQQEDLLAWESRAQPAGGEGMQDGMEVAESPGSGLGTSGGQANTA